METDWAKFFLSFFDKNKSSIGIVMYAEGCREGWLQGELFRFSEDQDFVVNSFKLTKLCGKLDLYGELPFIGAKPQKMVAEIKIISPSFESKNIDGNHNIEKYIASDIVKITETHLGNVNFREGSILKDVVRLKSISNIAIEKYMILVIPKYESSEINENLEKAIYSISLSDVIWERKYIEDHFDVRIWLIN